MVQIHQAYFEKLREVKGHVHKRILIDSVIIIMLTMQGTSFERAGEHSILLLQGNHITMGKATSSHC
jgi:hypothetical protein